MGPVSLDIAVQHTQSVATDVRPGSHSVLMQVKAQVLLSATEAAEMILRVDDIIKCAPRQRSEQ